MHVQYGASVYIRKCVERDLEKAFAWYKRSAEHGYVQGMQKLAECYQDGKGTKVNLEERDRWLRKVKEIHDEEDEFYADLY